MKEESIIGMKDYVDMQVKTIETQNQLKYQSLDKALEIALASLNKRLEGMNEFRNTLKDQTNTFVTKTEYEASHQRVLDDVKILREAKATSEGKASQTSVLVAYILTAVGILISVLMKFIK